MYQLGSVSLDSKTENISGNTGNRFMIIIEINIDIMIGYEIKSISRIRIVWSDSLGTPWLRHLKKQIELNNFM